MCNILLFFTYNKRGSQIVHEKYDFFVIFHNKINFA